MALFNLGKYNYEKKPFSKRFENKEHKRQLWESTRQEFQVDKTPESSDIDLDEIIEPTYSVDP